MLILAQSLHALTTCYNLHFAHFCFSFCKKRYQRKFDSFLFLFQMNVKMTSLTILNLVLFIWTISQAKLIITNGLPNWGLLKRGLIEGGGAGLNRAFTEIWFYELEV